MSNNACVYFIADLHLDPERIEATALALSFFKQLPDSATLYILGDLFEYWIGDDAGTKLYEEVVTALSRLNDRGCETFVMHGNRDFLLGDAFADAAGVTLVREDELLISLDGVAVLLMHGDTLCTDDKAYQVFRHTVRDKDWQTAFLNKPAHERVAYAQQLREQSSELNTKKSQTIMDVNEDCVQERMAAHDCTILIHGHTHRPAVHCNPDNNQQRMVVGDWHTTYAQYVVHDNDRGLQLKRFDSAPCTPAPSV